MTSKAIPASIGYTCDTRKSTSDHRCAWLAALALVLLLTAYLLSAAFRTPSPWTLQIGVAGDTRFSSGFFLPERSARRRSAGVGRGRNWYYTALTRRSCLRSD